MKRRHRQDKFTQLGYVCRHSLDVCHPVNQLGFNFTGCQSKYHILDEPSLVGGNTESTVRVLLRLTVEGNEVQHGGLYNNDER